MKHDVFISYSNQDKHIALAICARLEVDRIRCWIAPRDVPAGKSWPAAILDAIGQCRVMVLVLSSASNASKDVAREVISAAQSGKMIVPFRIDDVIPKDVLDYYLKDLHWLDAVTPPLAAHIEVLAAQLKAALEAAGPRSEKEPALPTTPSSPSSRSGRAASSSLRAKLQRSLVIAATIAGFAIGSVYFFRGAADKSSVDTGPSTVSEVTASDTAGNPPAPGQRIADRLKDGSKGPDLVVIPGGTFEIGAVEHDKEAQPNERPPITVNVAPLAVGVYEVTRQQFERFVETEGAAFRNMGGCHRIVEGGWKGDPDLTALKNPYSLSGQHPVVCVSWQAADAFASWLSEETGHRYRLPTEQEQEYFTRAGRVGTVLPWGDSFAPEGCKYVNGQRTNADNPGTPCTNDAYGYQLLAVGSLSANAFALHDTLGNAAEFSSSCSRSAPGAVGDCAHRVVKGGSANDLISGLRISSVGDVPPDHINPAIGFRIVRELDDAERNQQSGD